MAITGFIRDIGSTLTLGAIDSTADIARAQAEKNQDDFVRKNAADKRADRNDSRQTAIAQRIDRQQQKSIKSLQKDVEKIEKKSRSDFMASKSALKGLQKQIDRRGMEAKKKAESILAAGKVEEQASARIAKKMQAALATSGGGMIDAMITKALKDGRLTMPELTQLVSGVAQFAAQGFNGVRGEIAINDGFITELEGDISSLSLTCEGIDENSRLISGISTTLTDQGMFDAGDQLTNLANGSLFFRGRRLAVDALMFPLVLLKSSTCYVKFDREDEDFSDWIMSDVDPALVCTGHRVIVAGSEGNRDSDGAGFSYDSTTSSFVPVVPNANGLWPVGSLVEVKGELGVAPSFNSIIKVAGSYGITTFDRWYTSLAPLLSEKLGSFLGLGDGADFVNGSDSSDD